MKTTTIKEVKRNEASMVVKEFIKVASRFKTIVITGYDSTLKNMTAHDEKGNFDYRYFGLDVGEDIYRWNLTKFTNRLHLSVMLKDGTTGEVLLSREHTKMFINKIEKLIHEYELQQEEKRINEERAKALRELMDSIEIPEVKIATKSHPTTSIKEQINYLQDNGYSTLDIIHMPYDDIEKTYIDLFNKNNK